MWLYVMFCICFYFFFKTNKAFLTTNYCLTIRCIPASLSSFKNIIKRAVGKNQYLMVFLLVNSSVRTSIMINDPLHGKWWARFYVHFLQFSLQQLDMFSVLGFRNNIVRMFHAIICCEEGFVSFEKKNKNIYKT